MKIALIIEHFDATRGAAEHLAVFLANELGRRGHEIHVICHDVSARINRYRLATLRASHDADQSHQAHPPPPDSPEEIDAGARVRIHRLRGMRVSTGFGFRRFGRRARRWCARHSIDVVHSFTVAFPGDIYHACAGLFATMNVQAQASGSRQNTSPWKRMMIGISGKQRTLLALEKRALDSAAPRRRLFAPPRVISLCDVMTQQMQHFYQITAERIVQLPTPRMDPNGAGDPVVAAGQRAWFRAHYQLEAADRVALFVGHDFRRKGLRFAIEAIAKTTTRWKLLVVGLGKAREYVELADSLGIGDQVARRDQRILFVGPTRDMNRLYAAADALVLPTFYDCFGLVVMEAFAHGLPVITTENLGARELIRAHHAGTIVATPQSVDEIARALDHLPLPGTPESADLSARARAAGAGISPEQFIDKLLELYHTVQKETPVA